MARTRGFTLIELLVVIIIICLLAGMTVALMNLFLRDAGTRQGATQVIVAFAQARQMAADKRRVHFLVFVNEKGAGALLESGQIEIHEDIDGDRVYTGDNFAGTADTDPLIKGMISRLPKFVFFTGHPQWVGVHPTGYCAFSPGFTEVNAGNFDAADAAGVLPGGDIIIGLPNDPGNLDPANNRMSMCLDIDRAAGKIRRWFFLNQGIN
ncbi:MAG: prepilin-type N-terminal cleavage/methylation domain-containing protein [Planctomycetota bacterium]|jgi:prepilin-type N-terminal cleavage/methylation domain-containing protein